MKNAMIVLGAVIVTALVAGGSFWGGMTYQTNQVDQARLSFESARGQAPGGQFSQEAPGFPPEGMLNGAVPVSPGGRGTTGQVKSIDGNVMTLSTAQDVTAVNLSDDTAISITVAGSSAYLTPGMRIIVTGERDDDGIITADQITVLEGNMNSSFDGAEQPYPPAAGMEP